MIAAALLSLPVLHGGQFIIESTFLDPAEHRAPRGEYVLYLNPSTPDGAGPAQYRLSLRGEVLMEAELPFTLRELAVTDAGFTVGYGFTNGDDPGGALVVGAIAPTGKVILDKRVEKTASAIIDAPPNPIPKGLVLDADQRAFAVRIFDPDDSGRGESWWRYTIPDGKRLADLRPLEAMGLKDNEHLRLIAARALPGTDLYLLHWWHYQSSNRLRRYSVDGAVFTLMAPGGSMVWRYALPLDYTVDGDSEASDLLEERVREIGAIRHTNAAGRFALWFVRDSVEVTFVARRLGKVRSDWIVEELARTPYSPPERDAETPPDVGSLALAPLDTIDLEVTGPPADAPRDVRAWAFVEDHFVAVVRDAEGTFRFVQWTRDGVRAHDQPITGLVGEGGPEAKFTHMAGDEWLCVEQDWDRRTPPHVSRANAKSGLAARLQRFAAPRAEDIAADIQAVAPTPDGCFVALVEFRPRYTGYSALYCFDRDGQTRWSVSHDYQDPKKLFSPADVVVTTEGLIVVVEPIADDLRVFRSNGKHLRTIDLVKTLGSEGRRPFRVSAAADGAVLVYASETLWHMRPNGDVLGRFSPRFGDGRTPRELARNAQFTPRGELWTYDNYAFLRMGDDGVVVERSADRPSPGVLYEPGARAIVDGRICIQDRRTGALHVWHEDGALAWIGAVEPKDSQLVENYGRIAAAGDGSLWVESRERQYLGWDAQGARLGHRSFDVQPTFPTSGKHVWAWGRNWRIILREESGAELVRVARHPDNRWIRGVDDAVCPDADTLAVLSDSTVLLYSATGEPRDSIAIPEPAFRSTIHGRGEWLLVAASQPNVLFIHRPTGTVQRVSLPTPKDEENWTHGFSADGKRLLSLQVEAGNFTLHRFELP